MSAGGPDDGASGPPVRRVWRIRGVVQGVGYRPFVVRQATRLGLTGRVANRAGDVLVEAQGAGAALGVLGGLLARGPALARVEALEVEDAAPRDESGFTIVDAAQGGAPAPSLPPDLGPCDDCRAEIEDPAGRRFGAELDACPACGPRLEWRDGSVVARGPTALDAALAALEAGRILAVQGVGGFQLTCDATAPALVARLRERKRRPTKPFAVMVRDAAAAARHAELDPASRAELEGPARPIVLLPKRAGGELAPGIAPGRAELGLMLPASPLHVLLAKAGTPLVLTSGNLSDEPLALTPAEARDRLGGIADAFLSHDRPILERLDDSVVRVEAGTVRPLRRARGLFPAPVPLVAPVDLVAAGGDLKGAVAVVTGGRAHVGPHLGDLADPRSRQAWKDSLARLLAATGAVPEAVACDMHPDYGSSGLAEALGLPLLRVQHHHAHLAAVLAEHGLEGPALGLVYDGTGYGEDGTAWGGEVLLGDALAAPRVARLRPVGLPGGEAAARQPWRMALAWAVEAGLGPEVVPVPAEHRGKVPALLEAWAAGVGSPPSSSVGRLFDAVAGLLGICAEADHEGQAAAALEAAAVGSEGPELPFPVAEAAGLLELDPRPLVRALVEACAAARPVGELAAAFHAALARASAEVASCLAERHRVRRVVLAGGCFQNARLARLTTLELQRRGLDVVRPTRFPTNDGGLALGQAAVAARRLGQG